MAALRSQMSGQINVEVDSAPQANLAEIMAEIREEYESIAKKNNKQLDEWYKEKVRVDQKAIRPSIHFQYWLLPVFRVKGFCWTLSQLS